MSENFIEKMKGLTGKSEEDLLVEFADFTEIVNRQFDGRLEGEELITKSESLFRQKCRSMIKSDEASGAVKITIHVTGVCDLKDGVRWDRNTAFDIYKLNPNKAIMEGMANEYRITDNGVMKRSFDQATRDVVEEMIKQAPPNAEEVEELIFVAPVDSKKRGFGGKENKNFGQELPLHKYSCYVYGVAEIDGSDDVRWTKLMLRNGNTNHSVKPNQSYTVSVIDMSKKDDEEYNFIDVDEMIFVEDDWNPFDGKFMEEVISMNFIQNRVIELGDVDEYLRTVEAKKESGKFSDWNAAILVEADVSKIFLSEKEGYSDRMYVDDDSLRWGDDDGIEGNINVWVGKVNVIDFGEYSRLLMTCYPSRGKPPKDAPDGTKGRMQLNGYGLYAFAKYKTRFEIEE